MYKVIKSPVISLDIYDIKAKKEKTVKLKGRAFNSLTYRKSGAVRINIGNKAFVSNQDCITFIPRGCDYATKIVSDTTMIAVHFNFLDEYAVFSEPFVLKRNTLHLQKFFDLIFEAYSANNIFLCYSHLYNLLFEVEKLLMSSQEKKIISVVSEAKLKIEKNFTDNNFNIDSLISELSVCATYLRREFKNAYSLTPIEYLKYMRQQKAISLLASDYYSVNEIAKECGYSSTSYFIQSFKKSTGYSPLSYKKFFLS